MPDLAVQPATPGAVHIPRDWLVILGFVTVYLLLVKYRDG